MFKSTYSIYHGYNCVGLHFIGAEVKEKLIIDLFKA